MGEEWVSSDVEGESSDEESQVFSLPTKTNSLWLISIRDDDQQQLPQKYDVDLSAFLETEESEQLDDLLHGEHKLIGVKKDGLFYYCFLCGMRNIGISPTINSSALEGSRSLQSI